MGDEPRNFTVVTIGCLECGHASELVGVYATRDEAEAAAGPKENRYGGDYRIVIWALDGTDRWGDQPEPLGGYG